ncbi:secondary thiamine-phosphate synthase enzyme YjbQ [Spirulina subsalsa FACHB-351]|uniref:Secondary thiamine-phosphate synthase enzyme YjbQ n=1 Tax=Spirulina subsalsa FACHB-351 TaxID=234711 RepID=A0ABT3L1U3_9CYAN|nr:secondary thiamine-phosphate synthase enzyme YjbQ [Spirulina subsalsa]MCW6035445.1 secondary thiamine-phosphate synthase enzyme YjbQ [Spirulina subsalsa FACHB-351]
MHIVNTTLDIQTEAGIRVYDVTSDIKEKLAHSGIHQGHIVVFSQHTTTAIAINENEERLWADLKTYLTKLAPPDGAYLHNDLHLRDVPPEEPENAHSHLMAMTLSSSETIPVIDGKLALGQWQSVLFVELDGPRPRKLLLQIMGNR